MITARIDIGPVAIDVVIDGDEGAAEARLPVGIVTLTAEELHHDPPRPEELTNAIGAVHDHLDDVVRAFPHLLEAAVELRGPEVAAIAAIELGATPEWPFVLSREAAEDVFRTVATEPRQQRRHNPGLPPELVDPVVAGSCAVVAVMRRLHLGDVAVRP